MSPELPQQKTESPPQDAAPGTPAPGAAATDKDKPAPQLAPSQRAQRAGRWLHQHRDFFNGNLGWITVKQGAASFIASFNMMCAAIPTAFGLDYLHSRAADKVARLGKDAGFVTKLWAEPSIKNPLRAMAFVATGFTMYRGTRKIFNKVYEKIFNPNNTEEKTIQEVSNLKGSIGAAIRDIMPAESQSTPFGAIALGGIRSLYNPNAVEAAHRPVPGNSIRNVILHPQGKFREQVVIDILGYSAFFELSDRLYKDKQLLRGMWNGKPHSIATIKHSAMDENAPAGDNDPSLHRLVFRRIMPTALGITAYTLTHRMSKMITGAPAAPHFMSQELYDKKLAAGAENLMKSDSAKTLFKKFAHSFGAEFAAIGTFFAHSAVAEKYEKAYDALFEKLQNKEKSANDNSRQGMGRSA